MTVLNRKGITMTDDQLMAAAHEMDRRGGGFASAIATAYFRADRDNKTKLLLTFGDLFSRHAPETDETIREVVAQIGVLDEGFYLYFDDPDYCRATRKAGWGVLYCPQARVIHLVGRSNPVESLTLERGRRPHYYYASRSRYFAKSYGTAGLWLANIMWTAGHAIALVREIVGSKAQHACKKEWCDIWVNAFWPLKVRAPCTTVGQGS